MDALLGTVFDRELAERFGVSPIAVGRRRRELKVSAKRHASWTPEAELLIGTMPDSQLGEQLGISVDAVRYHKYKLGIPSWQPQTPDAIWVPETDSLLGTASDEEVSIRLGISRMMVTRRRLELGIPSWTAQNRVLPKGVSVWSAEAHCFYQARRRSKVEGLVDTLTYEQWAYACEWFDNCCAYCNAAAFLTEDHLVPVKVGGPRTALNILPACLPCNQSKGPRRAHLWIYWRFGTVKGKEIVDRIIRYLTEVRSQ